MVLEPREGFVEKTHVARAIAINKFYRLGDDNLSSNSPWRKALDISTCDNFQPQVTVMVRTNLIDSAFTIGLKVSW